MIFFNYKKKFFFIILFIIFIIIFNIKSIDNIYLEENIKDLNGKFFHNERWGTYNKDKLNYQWLKHYSYIVHGITDKGPYNKCDIILDDQFNLFEINFFDNNGFVSLSSRKNCPIDDVFKIMNRVKYYIIIDIKGDFETISKQIIEYASLKKKTDKIIFQIYKPEDLSLYFNYLKKYVDLPGPIITTYRSRRSIKYLANTAIRNKVEAMTVNIDKIQNIKLTNQLNYFIFPVHNCGLHNELKKKKKISGVYVKSSLKCIKIN